MTKEMPRHADMMIKICGMREPENIRDAAALCPMLMGFIFHDKSPRDASGLDPEVVKSLPGYVRPVAVTVDKEYDAVMELCGKYGFGIVQLHGSESPELCRRYKDAGLVVLKAIGVDADTDWEELRVYEGKVDMFLFDTLTPSHGGSGRKFDWSILDSYPLDIPYLLSGGIGADDADRVIAAMRPGMAGVDINSRFETAPGHKDLQALIHFILTLRKHNEYEPDRKPFWEKAQ